MLKLLTSACLVLSSISCFAQVAIVGPACVEPSFPYRYDLKATWKTSSNMQICVTGGVIMDSSSTCLNGLPLNSILVKWQVSEAQKGSIELTSTEGNTRIDVTISMPLEAGKIGEQSVLQTVSADSAVISIECSPAAGGGCQAAISYLWQSSQDAVNWVNMEFQTKASLHLSQPLQRTTYFRRKNIHTDSTNISFSDVATILVVRNHKPK